MYVLNIVWNTILKNYVEKFILYLKFKFKWVSSILPVNPTKKICRWAWGLGHPGVQLALAIARGSKSLVFAYLGLEVKQSQQRSSDR